MTLQYSGKKGEGKKKIRKKKRKESQIQPVTPFVQPERVCVFVFLFLWFLFGEFFFSLSFPRSLHSYPLSPIVRCCIYLPSPLTNQPANRPPPPVRAFFFFFAIFQRLVFPSRKIPSPSPHPKHPEKSLTNKRQEKGKKRK